VVDKFRDKYGAGDVKKYYSKFDVAVLAQALWQANEEWVAHSSQPRAWVGHLHL